MDDDEYWYRLDEAMGQLEDDILKRASDDQVKGYLGRYGDAVTARIRGCCDTATSLLAAGYYAASLVTSVTGIELTIKYLLVAPLLRGALLPNDLANLIFDRAVRARSTDDRNILPALLRRFGIGLSEVALRSGDPLWKTFQGPVLESRNKAVHRGDRVSRRDARRGIVCLAAFEREVVEKLADRLGFSRRRTGCWAKIERGDPGEPSKGSGATFYEPASPFDP